VPILRRATALLLTSILWVAPTGCRPGDDAPPNPREPRLVLLFAPCTVSKAYLSPYEPSVVYTPNLAAFARESRVFTRHQTESGKSGIAYASLFSGRQAPGHGVYAHPRALDESLVLVTEAFADAGYETFFWGAHGMASAELHYAQGVPPEHRFQRRLAPQEPAFHEILSKLRADPGYRAFVTTDFSVTHLPYSPERLDSFCGEYPAECRDLDAGHPETRALAKLYARNWIPLALDFPDSVERLGLSEDSVTRLVRVVDRLYRSNVHFLDAIFGELIDALRDGGVLDESLVVFTADHGEVLYRDNALFKWSHGHQLAPEVLGVPLIVRAPALGVPAGRYDGVTRSIDVFPTMAGLAGVPIDPDAGIEGVDLSQELRGLAPPPPLRAFSHTTLMMPAMFGSTRRMRLFRSFYPRQDISLVWVSVREGDRVAKYRNLGGGRFGFEVFDLAADPAERSNVFDPADPQHRRLSESLVDYKQALVDDFHRRAGSPTGDVPEDRSTELLRSLGYIE
jgi:arylsulfatase A-like enzyme